MDKDLEQINKIGDFIHQAFCVDRSTKFVKYIQPTNGFNLIGMMYEIEDKKRGLFYITISKPL